MAAHPSSAVYDLHPSTRGRPQASLLGQPNHAGRPDALRVGLHHLHADRLAHPVGRGPDRGPVAGPQLYGEQYVPATPRRYDKKVKNAQEAHEAIRPAGDSFRTPEESRLSGDQRRLYELIWMRTVASQMADAVGQSVNVRLGATAASPTGLCYPACDKCLLWPARQRWPS